MSVPALDRRAREARHWLFDSCFPLWAEHGVTRAGLFPESLTLEGDEAPTDTTRVRVQARQTYVFAEAWRLGWQRERAARLVDAGITTLAGPALRPDGLAGRLLATDGSGLTDDVADLYDAAFVLFALAEAARGPGPDTLALKAANDLLSALDRLARDHRHGGYFETLPAQAARLQNPHMHLLEACLALHKAEPAGGHLARAGEIIGLFETRFTAGPGGLLGERFLPDWSGPAPGAADIVEPGHQFEWVWLLHVYARATGQPVSATAGQLYDFACSTLDAAGRAVQEVTRSGEVHDGSRRTWTQTEALKAHLAMFEASGEARFASAASKAFDVLMDDYLTPDGGWIDQFDAEGRPVATTMPASTGYHVVLAFSDLMRVTGA